MLPKFVAVIPPTALQVAMVLILSFLIGLEREALKREGRRTFGGVRTFPLLGLLGYGLAYLSAGYILATVLGFAVVGGFMLVSYWYKLRFSTEAGITTEISGLVVYLMGALVYHHFYWMACTMAVVSLFLLELKESLEGLTEHIAPEEVVAFTKFLLLTAVILPLVPNQDFTAFRINPYRTWLVVVAVSGVSYGSYVILRLVRNRAGVFLSALLGGIYSSTVTTVVLAKRAREESRPFTYSGSILAASGMMYIRILVLVGIFNKVLMKLLLPGFLPLALAALAAGWIASRARRVERHRATQAAQTRNPLDLGAALTFAAVFLAAMILTHLAVQHLGHRGVYTLATLMGVTDVDPFIMGLTQAPPEATPLRVAAFSVVIATASNNAVKGLYAWGFAKGLAGRRSLLYLASLALLGLLPLLWI